MVHGFSAFEVFVMKRSLTLFFILSLFLPFFIPLYAQKKSTDHPKLFQYAIYLVINGFINEDKLNAQKMFETGLQELEIKTEDIFFTIGKEAYQITVGDQTKSLELLDQKSPKLLLILYLEIVFDFIKLHYRGEKLLDALRIDCINGMLRTLDPHSRAFTKQEWEKFYTHIEGEIFGVGMYLEIRDGRLYGSNPIPGGPAHNAGILHQDEIIQIDSESTINMSAEEAVSRIRGAKGTEVILTIQRKGEIQPLIFSIARDRIRVKNVEGTKLPSGVAYLQFTTFSENSLKEIQKKLTELGPAKSLRGLILDLRNNTGGLLDQAIAISDFFINQGDIVSISDGTKVQNRVKAKNGKNEPQYPICILVNENSASGSEVLAGALQKNDRGFLIGSQTFGKGSMQSPYAMGESGAYLKLTIGEYLIPKDISIQGTGLTPDILTRAVTLESHQPDLFLDETMVSEKAYESPLVSKFNVKESPRFEIPYLWKSLSDKEMEFKRDSFILGDYDFSKDDEVLMAEKLLLRHEEELFERESFLTKNASYIQSLKESYHEEILEKLALNNIDWTTTSSFSPLFLEADFLQKMEEITAHWTPGTGLNPTSLESKLNWQVKPAQKGEIEYKVLEIELKLTNRGNTVLTQIKGKTRSDFLRFKNGEFLFGKMMPGETVTRVLKINLPKYTSGSQRDLHIDISNGTEKISVISARILLEEEPRPEFSFQTQLWVEGKKVYALKQDQQATMSLKITNSGKGPCSKGMAYLTHDFKKSIFLEKGREELKPLAPGESQEVRFQFRIDNIPTEKGFFKVTLYDLLSEVALVQSLPFPKSNESEWSMEKEFRVPEIQLDFPTLPEPHFSNEAQIQFGLKLDSSQLKSLSIFHRYRPNAKKAYYFHTEKIAFKWLNNEPQIKLNQAVTLQKGSNDIVVVVTDFGGTRAVKEYQIWKAE